MCGPQVQPILTCVMLSLTALSRFLSTSAGSVSSSSTLGPCRSGPKAHTDRAASKSQLYLSPKKSLTFLRGQSRLMLPVSMSTARPCRHTLHLGMRQSHYEMMYTQMSAFLVAVYTDVSLLGGLKRQAGSWDTHDLGLKVEQVCQPWAGTM